MVLSKVAGGVAVLVAGVAVLVATTIPHKSLDWDGTVLPMARAYAKRTTTEILSNPKRPLESKIVMITGATSGIGLALTKSLSRLGAKVIAHGRSASKLAALQQEIPSIETFQANLFDLDDVAQAAKQFVTANEDDEKRIDILINNAGIHDAGQNLNNLLGLSNFSSPQGYDRVFAVNYLSHVLLTEKLAPLLARSAHPMIVQLCSSFHWAVDGSDLKVNDEGGAPPIASQPGGSHGFLAFRTQRSYANSKLAQIFHARALKQRHSLLSKARIISICPAWVGTQIAGQQGSAFYALLNSLAYPADGWGQASTLFGLFDDSDNDYYSNTSFMDFWFWLVHYFPSWAYQLVPFRDAFAAAVAYMTLPTQRFFPLASGSKSSPESYDTENALSLYDWSLQVLADYL